LCYAPVVIQLANKTMKILTNTVIVILILIAAAIVDLTGRELRSRLSNFFFSPCPFNGHCVIEKDGVVSEGQTVDGKRHGHWVVRLADGGVFEGPYVDGKKHGHWVAVGYGQVQEGPYVDGKRHGKWVSRFPDVGVLEGPYVDGKEHGKWITRFPDGTVKHVTYRNGELVEWY